jgi:mRNA interferase RelE/StbE
LSETTSASKRKYTVNLDRTAEKGLRKLPRNIAARIVSALQALADDPYPPAARKLEGYDDLYRLRIGDWRAIYTVDDAEIIILVLDIGPRKDIYRGY